MAKPPSPGIRPPSPPRSYDDIGKGGKLTLKDVASIVAGAYPLTWENKGPTVNVIEFDEVPPGVYRVYVRGYAFPDAGGTILVFGTVLLTGEEGITDGTTADITATTGGGVNLRPIVLRPGDQLKAIDQSSVGGDVAGSVGFVDVEVK